MPLDEDAAYDQPYTTPSQLNKAGITFSLDAGGQGHIASRNLPCQAAQAVAYGLPHDEAMKAITKNAAEIWGMGDQIGTIEEGK